MQTLGRTRAPCRGDAAWSSCHGHSVTDPSWGHTAGAARCSDMWTGLTRGPMVPPPQCSQGNFLFNSLLWLPFCFFTPLVPKLAARWSHRGISKTTTVVGIPGCHPRSPETAVCRSVLSTPPSHGAVGGSQPGTAPQGPTWESCVYPVSLRSPSRSLSSQTFQRLTRVLPKRGTGL